MAKNLFSQNKLGYYYLEQILKVGGGRVPGQLRVGVDRHQHHRDVLETKLLTLKHRKTMNSSSLWVLMGKWTNFSLK